MMTAVAACETRAHASEAYLDAVTRLYALGQELAPMSPLADGSPAPGRKWDIEEMRTLCTALGNPERCFPSVLIAGTNGKGSTAATLASVLVAAGHKTGLYTSPHLVEVKERVVLASSKGGGQIPDEAFARLFDRVEEASTALVESGRLPQPSRFFEVVTAIGFLYFAEEKVDIAVLEVGLGGRLDATNVVDPLVSVITDVALDHQAYLGDTISEIAREKAGILRKNGVLVTLPQHPEANQTIGEVAEELELKAFSAAEFLPARFMPARQTPAQWGHVEGAGAAGDSPNGALPESALPEGALPEIMAPLRNRYTVMLDGVPLEVDSPLAGHHQQRNIALSIATAQVLRNLKGYAITNAAIEAGIREAMWPGRLEFVAPNLLLDVAHNPAGAWTLRAAIAQLPESQPKTLIFSCLSDKNLTEMSQILFPLFDSSSDSSAMRDHIVLAPIANPRAAKLEDLLAAAQALGVPAHVAPHLAAALEQARRVTPPGGLIIATGSVYLVGAIRNMALAYCAGEA